MLIVYALIRYKHYHLSCNIEKILSLKLTKGFEENIAFSLIYKSSLSSLS